MAGFYQPIRTHLTFFYTHASLTENLAKLPQLHEVCLQEFGQKTFSHHNYKFTNKSCGSYWFLIIKPKHNTFDADSII